MGNVETGSTQRDMRCVFAFIAIIGISTAAPTAPQTRQLLQAHGWQWEVTVDVFEGVLEGFFSNFKDLKACANDTVSAYDDINNAASLIKQETPSSVLQGIKDLGEALKALKDGLVDCKAAAGEIESFIKGFEQFTNPASFVFHVGKDLIVNGKDIYQEITQAVSLWQSQSYLDSGEQIGKALFKLVVGTEHRFINTSATYSNTTEGSPIVYLIRHGEKDSHGCLSHDGQKRSKNLVELFKDGGKFSKPKSLYAYHYPLFTCQRCKQMLTPISQSLDKSIDFNYGSSPDKASDAMKKSLKDSKAPVLAAWEHEHIHDLAKKLGAKDVPKWKDSDYDTVYVLTFDS